MSNPAFDEVMLGELAETFEALGKDPAVRAIVLSGQGAAFSMGANLPQVKRAGRAGADWSASDARAFAWMLWRIDSCAKPTIARVHGMALGGGVGLVCACDFVVASGDASFAVTDSSLGRVPSAIRPYLVNAVGREQTERLAAGGARIDAEQARSIGLVHAVVPKGELDAATKTLGSIFQNGPNVARRLKALIRVSPRRHSSAHVGCHLHSRNRCSQGAHPLPDLIDRQTGISEDEPSLTGPRTRRRTGEQR